MWLYNMASGWTLAPWVPSFVVWLQWLLCELVMQLSPVSVQWLVMVLMLLL